METYTLKHTSAEVGGGRWGLNLRIHQSSDGEEVAKKLGIFNSEEEVLAYVAAIEKQLTDNPTKIPTL